MGGRGSGLTKDKSISHGVDRNNLQHYAIDGKISMSESDFNNYMAMSSKELADFYDGHPYTRLSDEDRAAFDALYYTLQKKGYLEYNEKTKRGEWTEKGNKFREQFKKLQEKSEKKGKPKKKATSNKQIDVTKELKYSMVKGTRFENPDSITINGHTAIIEKTVKETNVREFGDNWVKQFVYTKGATYNKYFPKEKVLKRITSNDDWSYVEDWVGGKIENTSFGYISGNQVKPILKKHKNINKIILIENRI